MATAATGSGKSSSELRLNLGGEAEEPECINQQPNWADLGDTASRSGGLLRDELNRGEPFLFCDNRHLPFPDGNVDEIITNGVPLDQTTWLGPGISTSEIKRVLRSGGIWRHDGTVVWIKP